MMFILLFTLTFLSQVVLAQGPTPSVFSRDVLLANPDSEEKKKEEESNRKRAVEYINGLLKKEIGRGLKLAPPRSGIRREEDQKNFNECVDKISSQFGGNDLKKYLDLFNFCNDKFKLMEKSEMDKLREMGIRSAIDFENKVAKEILELNQRQQDLDRESLIEKDLEFFRFDSQEINSNPISLPGFEGLFKTVDDFTSIAVHFNKEKSLKSVIENNQSINNQLKEELIKLNYLSMRLKGDDPCPNDLSIKQLAFDDPRAMTLLSDFNGFNQQDFSVSPPHQIFFGLDKERASKKIDKFSMKLEGGKELFIYKYTEPGTENEIWVLAELDTNNQTVRYSHYKLNSSKPDRRLARTSNGDITLVGIHNFHRRLGDTPGRELYLDMNVGLSLDANRERIPLIGTTSVPTGNVDLAYIKLSSHAPGLWTETKLALQVEQVKISTILRPNQNANWGTSAELSYRTFDNELRAAGSVRIHNLLIGASSNMSDQASVNAGIYKGRTFIMYETDFKELRKLKVGTAIGNGGGVYADTDFKKFHNVTVVINLN
ncbi:MAG: hypothetical protein EP319_06925 [Deltaproteobacteria bacterium]|nr:MAG: hypothetical protein EP319_06925 [Deltaproteobacteria bacterium]